MSSRRIGIGCRWWWATTHQQGLGVGRKQEQVRSMVLKAPNRAAVHGTRPPLNPVVDIQEVEEEIKKAKKKKQEEIQEIEKRLDSSHFDKPTSDSSNNPSSSDKGNA